MWERVVFGQPPPPLFIGQAQGVEDQNALKGGFSKKPPKSAFHYSWKHFSTTVKSENISVCLRIILVPTKTILDAFRNIFRSMIFISEKQPKRFRQLRKFPIFSPKKSQKFPEQFWHPPRISRHVPKQFWLNGILQNNFFGFTETIPVFSLRNFSVVSETFPVTFSQTPCLLFSR